MTVTRLVFFFNDTATTEIYTLSLHDALPICLRRGDLGAVRPWRGPGSGVALQKARAQVPCRAQLVVTVSGGLDDVCVRAERRVVHERLAADHAKVDAQFDAVGQGAKARGGVVTVQPQIEGKVIAGARGDDHKRDPVFGCDTSNQPPRPPP